MKKIDISLVEFMVKEESIDIIPNFEVDVLNLISGNFGPFSPQVPTSVPLWLALELKRQQRCTIKPPSWLEVDYLTLLKKKEDESPPGSLEDVGYHFFTIGFLLIKETPDDIQDVKKVSILLEDIYQRRANKLRQGMHSIGKLQTSTEPLEFIKLNNATSLEIHSLRYLLTHSLDEFYKLRDKTVVQEEEEIYY